VTTIALTNAEAQAIARAHAALNWVKADTFPWPSDGGADIKGITDELRGSLDDYASLTNSSTHPADLFPDLAAGHPDNAMETALDLVTQDIRELTGALVGLAGEAERAARMREEGRAA
jgi:hypothetical protein